MQPRMNHPAMIVPGAMEALQAVSKLAECCGLSKEVREIVHLRASQINGCSVCVDMDWHGLKKSGGIDQRAFAVAAWRDAPYFTDAERAALALTEAVTRLSDREDPVPDTVWDEAARHFDEKQLSALLLSIHNYKYVESSECGDEAGGGGVDEVAAGAGDCGTGAGGEVMFTQVSKSRPGAPTWLVDNFTGA